MKLSDIYNSICIDSSVENKNCILLFKKNILTAGDTCEILVSNITQQMLLAGGSTTGD